MHMIPLQSHRPAKNKQILYASFKCCRPSPHARTQQRRRMSRVAVAEHLFLFAYDFFGGFLSRSRFWAFMLSPHKGRTASRRVVKHPWKFTNRPWCAPQSLCHTQHVYTALCFTIQLHPFSLADPPRRGRRRRPPRQVLFHKITSF